MVAKISKTDKNWAHYNFLRLLFYVFIFQKNLQSVQKKNEKRKKALRPQFLVNMDKICMRKDFKYAQRPQAAFGRPKDPVAASGRLKILYDYISNNSKILLDTIWISYSNCDEQKILEKVFFFFLMYFI